MFINTIKYIFILIMIYLLLVSANMNTISANYTYNNDLNYDFINTIDAKNKYNIIPLIICLYFIEII